MAKNKLQSFPQNISQITLTWIINLNTKTKTIKHPEENIGGTLCYHRREKDSLR